MNGRTPSTATASPLCSFPVVDSTAAPASHRFSYPTDFHLRSRSGASTYRSSSSSAVYSGYQRSAAVVD
nr:hypothetical protein Itr_chr08CG18030 [Ipomoea trifida]